MCGITGIVDFDGLDLARASEDVRRMTATLSHRGPDADGIWADNRAALGHRRLSIIDLSSGDQPMSLHDGKIQIVFNGEIYNFRELRRELESLGHSFRTWSDTEVILFAYLQWGEKCVARLNGMFAFAIWDVRDGRLFLARDRVGKKPLYYARIGGRLVFGSELKAIRAAGNAIGELNPTALDCYFSLGYIPAPRTIYQGVEKLSAAHWASFTTSGLKIERYWDLDFPEPRSVSAEESMAELEALFEEAVSCRLVSDVPLGAFLSAGIDSSLVVACMARLMNEPVRTHTIGFADSRFDESEGAGRIARHLGTSHNMYLVEPEVADVLDRIAWHADEPFADSSALPTWYVCKMTRQSVTVALSGDGGDEAFGGYSFRYLPHVFESRIRSSLPAALRYAIFGTLGSLWPASARLPRPLRLKSIFENLATGDSHAFYRDLIWLREDTRSRLYRRDFLDSIRGFTPFDIVSGFYEADNAETALSRGRYTDINVYMTDDVLVKVDRMSMAHGLEVRSPLLDYRMLEFAARLPEEQIISQGQGKIILRKLASSMLPAGMDKLPKKGFSIPAAEWLRTGLKDRAGDAMFRSRGVISDSLDRHVLERLWKEHQGGSRDHSVFLWSVMMLGIWEDVCHADVAADGSIA